MVSNSKINLYNCWGVFLLFLVLLNSICLSANSQSLPDSIVVIKNTYVLNSLFEKSGKEWTKIREDSLYQIKKNTFISAFGEFESESSVVNNAVVTDLVRELNDPDNLKNTLARYFIDTNWIKANPEKLLEISRYARRFSWNTQQKDLILKELVKIKYYENELDRYLNDGCCFTMHNSYRYEYVIKFYSKGRLVNQITSRKFIWGYKYPWTDINNNRLYSLKIENILDIFQNIQKKIEDPLKGKKLLERMVEEILKINSDTLNKLAPYSYRSEIDELKPTFNISYFSKMTGYGGYHGDGPLIQIILNNSEMFPNVKIEFLASIHNNTIYSRDSIINTYKKILDRIQSVKFIENYLKNNQQESLNILFFDNKPINKYTIENVNGTAAGWKEQDKYIESLKWYEKNNYKPSFDISEAIKTAEHNSCGCNYRFPNDFIEKAITFMINDKEKNHSRWLLLPDDTVLLFLMQGEKVMNFSYTDFGKNPGIQYPCVRFDKEGKIIPKKQ